MNLDTPVVEAGPVFKRFHTKLEKLGIRTLRDFLFHLPSRYDDLRLIAKIGQIQAGEIVTIQGDVIEINNVFTKRWKRLVKARIADETGEISVTWFNQPFIARVLHKGDKVSLAGKVEYFGYQLTIQSPEYEIIGSQPLLHTGRLVPVYPETQGLTSKWIRRQTYKILQDNKQNILEYIPDSILRKNSLETIITAFEAIHFPQTTTQTMQARRRLAFDELFLLQLASMQRKQAWDEEKVGPMFSIDSHRSTIESFKQTLPFTLTNAQQQTVEDMFTDMAKKKPMNRLLEGDVGSGKTVVAAIAMYMTVLNGYQAVIMAPTEILANQHFESIKRILDPLGIKIALATGSTKYKGDKDVNILVGTHAVLSKNISFVKLGLVVIDEQQRFGVAQRGFLREKGMNPHVLTMTATPIPRTIALTMYGDLDLSILDEMPQGRKAIKTWLVPQEKRTPGYSWMEKEIQENHSQAFIICPFIEESESMQTVKAATKEFERLQKEIFPTLRLGLLHGKMKGKEKDEVLAQFREKQFDILVSTPVVEVGIDIPNATIMVIEAAERFGLAQLHQLRGRVGRGEKQSYCLLFTEAKNAQTIERLKAMETTFSGPALAEIDLRLRGAGELYGTKQHGTQMLKVADFSDISLIQEAKNAAKEIFEHLSHYPLLSEKVNQLNLTHISPD